MFLKTAVQDVSNTLYSEIDIKKQIRCKSTQKKIVKKHKIKVRRLNVDLSNYYFNKLK